LIFNHKNSRNKSIKTFPIGAWNVWMCDMLLERSFQRLQHFSWKLICENYELAKLWDSQFDKLKNKLRLLFKILNFWTFYIALSIVTQYIVRKRMMSSLQIWIMVSCELVCLWFVSPLFWFQFALIAFFFGLCILISPWILAYEFVLILSWSFHPPYLSWEMHLGCVTKLKLSSLFFTFDIIEQTYRW
jgi:hypothetical protein